MSTGPEDAEINPTRPGRLSLLGRCPRCGRGHLFNGFLTVAAKCEVCGLDLSFVNSDDGPAVFVVMIVGFVVVGLALYVEFAYGPPYWIHAMLWVPLVIGLSLGLLRTLKGWLIAQQYRHHAAEGRIDEV